MSVRYFVQKREKKIIFLPFYFYNDLVSKERLEKKDSTLELVSGHLESRKIEYKETISFDPLEELLYGVELQRSLSCEKRKIHTEEGQSLEKKMRRLRFYLKELEFLERD